jgi:hypothetical protein
MSTPFRDAFTLWLEQHGPVAAPKIYQPGGFFGAPPVGWQIVVGRTTFVYRVPPETPDVLYIVLIERGAGRQALHSPFADMVRLLRLIQHSATGIRWIRGHVEPTKTRPANALSRERILAFYQRYLTTVSVGFENGIEWFGGDLAAFSWAAEKRNIRARLAPHSPSAMAIPHLNR